MASPMPARPGPPNGAGPVYFELVNGLRGLCALMVFAYHVGYSKILVFEPVGIWQTSFDYLLSSLRYGVELFFMISGLVIIFSIRRHATLASFYLDRLIRIFTLWIPLCALLYIVRMILAIQPVEYMGSLGPVSYGLASLIMLTPLLNIDDLHPALWSLTYEWLFYGVAGLCAALAARRRTLQAYAIAALAFALTALLIPRGMFFIVGVAIALKLVQARQAQTLSAAGRAASAPDSGWRARLARLFASPWLNLLLFLLAWRATGADDASVRLHTLQWFTDGRIFAALFALLFGSLFFRAIVLETSGQFGFLRHRVWQWLGDISFSLYMLHPLVMAGVKRPLLKLTDSFAPAQVQLALFAILALAISLAVSHLSQRLIERRLAGALRQAVHGRRQLRPA